MNKLLYLVIIASTLTMACNEDSVARNEVQGSWEWVRSVGGDAGHTLTPESEGITRQLLIDADTYHEYVNHALVEKGAYSLETKYLSEIGTHLALEVDSYGAFAVERTGGELMLMEFSYDGYTHTFRLK